MAPAKLDKLGLSSLSVKPDAQGMQVRGAGFGALSVNFLAALTGAPIQTPISGGVTFGTEPAQGNISRHGALGTVVFERNADGTIVVDPVTNEAVFVNTPIEISTVTSVNGATALSTFKFQGSLFAQGN